MSAFVFKLELEDLILECVAFRWKKVQISTVTFKDFYLLDNVFSSNT